VRRVLGIDLALNLSGFCITQGEQVAQHFILPISGRTEAKLNVLFHAICATIVREHIDVAVIERVERWSRGNVKTSTDTLNKMAWACGAAQAAVSEACNRGQSCSLHLYDPTEVRYYLTGRKTAPKGQMRENLRLRGYDSEGWSDDEVDALALALVYHYCNPEQAEVQGDGPF
jgi:Holliday junction resolvasome RuvABC endonuclease subunit